MVVINPRRFFRLRRCWTVGIVDMVVATTQDYECNKYPTHVDKSCPKSYLKTLDLSQLLALSFVAFTSPQQSGSDEQTQNRINRLANSEASVSKHESSEDNIVCNEVAGDGVAETERCSSKLSPGQLTNIANEDYELEQDIPLMRVPCISLQTKLSGLPPPSRAPPALTGKRRVLRPQISNIEKKHGAEPDACREDNVSESSRETESTDKNVQTKSKTAQQALEIDDIWGSVKWDMMDDEIKVEDGKRSDLPGFHCSTDLGERFVGIGNWTEEADCYEVSEGNNAADEAFETFDTKQYGMIIDEADEHAEIDDKHAEIDEKTCDELKYTRNGKERVFWEVNLNGDTLNRENGCFSPRKQVVEADLQLKIDNANKLEGMSNNQAEEIESIDKNGNGRESFDDLFIDLPNSEISGNHCSPTESTQAAAAAAALLGNQTMEVKISTPTYESQHVIDNPLFNIKLNRPAKTVDEDGTARRVSKKTVTTEADVVRVMKTKEFVTKKSVNSCDESLDARKTEHSPSISEHTDGMRSTKVATRGSNTKVNADQEREKIIEVEYSRKQEEERERERERSKDKMDVRTAVLEAREKLYKEKFSTEARCKAISDARERLGKASAEGRPPHNMYSSSSAHPGVEGESLQRCKARLERYRRTAERAANALAEKEKRDLLAEKEKEERNRVAELLDPEVRRWANGKEGNLRALLSTLQYILGPESGWQPIPLTKIITSASVRSAYRKATLCVHPDKLQQRGATVQQKYVCEKVFDLLKESWNKFSSEERC